MSNQTCLLIYLIYLIHFELILGPRSSVLGPRSSVLDPWSLILDPWSLILLIQASLTMVMMPSWCGTTLILIIRFRPLSIVFLWMVHFEISKLSRVSVWDCVSDFRCNFKTRSRFWWLPEWTANLHLFKFYWPHILKGKADKMHLKNHLLRRRRFSRFSDGIWQETWFEEW